MVADGAGTTRAAQWRHLPLAVVQAERARRRQFGQGWGAIFDAWDVAPPEAAPPPEASVTDDALARARAIAPEAATPEDLILLAGELSLGATSDQALAALAEARAAGPETDVAARQIWNQAILIVQQALDRAAFHTWLQPIDIRELTDGTAVLTAPNDVIAAYVRRNYGRVLGDALARATGKHVQVEIQVA
ncbi:MAG TPA: DnaA N-terminal domain-containing protein [Kouleothrix sp.]|nr:DnaA N-terminal domain-containing protein [Kouleothrix sp.]